MTWERDKTICFNKLAGTVHAEALIHFMTTTTLILLKTIWQAEESMSSKTLKNKLSIVGTETKV